MPLSQSEKDVPAKPVSRAEAEALLVGLPGSLMELLGRAAAVSLSGGAAPFTCGIVNAKSGLCSENCAFCSQSVYHDTAAAVYDLISEAALLERARLLAGSGVDYMGVVTSGTGPTARDFELICEAAVRIKRETGIRLCASLGVLDSGQAASLRQAGFTSYHHNLETSRSYYPQICSTHGYDLRVETVKQAKKAGLRVCSGGIFGLGESWAERLELSETLAGLEVDSIPVNFLNPIPGTPLENAPGLEAGDALALLGVLRLMHPLRDIVVCGGRGRCLGEWENSIFFAGANGLMVGDYLTTKGSPFEKDLNRLQTLGIIKHA